MFGRSRGDPELNDLYETFFRKEAPLGSVGNTKGVLPGNHYEGLCRDYCQKLRLAETKCLHHIHPMITATLQRAEDNLHHV